MFLVVALGLDGPRVAFGVLGDQVDATVRPPPMRPVVPQPHLGEPVRVPGVGFEEPFADPFELLAPLIGIGRQLVT